LVTAGLQTQISDRMVRRVNDALWEGERSLVSKKFDALQVEHQTMLRAYVNLQAQHMAHAKLHQDISQEYVALQELYMKQQAEYQDAVNKYTAKIDALQREHQDILREYVALQGLYMKQQAEYQDTVNKYINLQTQHSAK
jgi:predicted nuclease with TOPRIM domain